MNKETTTSKGIENIMKIVVNVLPLHRIGRVWILSHTGHIFLFKNHSNAPCISSYQYPNLYLSLFHSFRPSEPEEWRWRMKIYYSCRWHLKITYGSSEWILTFANLCMNWHTFLKYLNSSKCTSNLYHFLHFLFSKIVFY